jgi:predicted acetyltransferase
MDVEIHPISYAEKELLHHLLQLYMYDFSVYDGNELDENGLYTYPHFASYWQDPNRHPLLIRADGRIAGFALVTENTGDDGETTRMSEFLVMQKYRRKGVGEAAARMIFDRFPGRWMVTELEANVSAQRFWRRIIDRYTGGNFEDHYLADKRRVIQTFTVEPA